MKERVLDDLERTALDDSKKILGHLDVLKEIMADLDVLKEILGDLKKMLEDLGDWKEIWGDLKEILGNLDDFKERVLKKLKDKSIHPEIEWIARIRTNNELCDEENRFLEQRKEHIKESFAKYVGTDEEINVDDIPWWWIQSYV